MTPAFAVAALLAVLAAGGSDAATGGGRASLHDPVAQRHEPFQIFDNLYYVGSRWVSAFLLTTSQGSILIDALYGEFTDQALDGIRSLGLDPRSIRYVLITHGHYDHAGGARHLQETLGARIGMTEADWLLVESGEEVGEIEFEPPRRDLVLRDGDTITVGETTVTLRVTPGHTLGVLSLQFEVRDGEMRHDAFLFGGVGLNFSGAAQTRQYIDSVRRIRRIDGIEVNLTNHPGVGGLFRRAERLALRHDGEPHPFVARGDFLKWLDDLEAGALRKLDEERSAGEGGEGARAPGF